MQPVKCPVCGDTFKPRNRRQRLCSLKCNGQERAEQNRQRAAEKHGGEIYRYIDRGTPYVRINGKEKSERRYVYEQTHNVELQPWHHIINIDGNQNNVAPENLRLRNAKLEEIVQRTGKLPKDLGRRVPRNGKFAQCLCGGEMSRVTVSKAGRRQYTCPDCDNARQRDHRAS